MSEIPTITDDEVYGLLGFIRPLVRDRTGILHFVAGVDARKTAFTWEPTFLHPVSLELVVLGSFPTLHTYGAPAFMFFKPSIAEVLAQIPRHLFLSRNIVGFEVDEGTIGFSEDQSKHSVTTTLWGYV